MLHRLFLVAVVLPVAVAQNAKTCCSISPAASDAWCNANCNHSPPNCPTSLCKCTGCAPGPPPPGPGPIPKPVWPPAPPSPPPAPPPPGPESGCSVEQIQNHCTKCTNSKCTACAKDYGMSSDGMCIASCLLPGYSRPQPPHHPGIYNGIEWPVECVDGTQEHFFAIGDWGGVQPGIPAPNIHGRRTETKDIDEHAQTLVADVFNARAGVSKPRFVVNVGDNFYWGGLDNKGAPHYWAEHCGDFVENPATVCSHFRFKQFWEDIYNAPALQKAPWFGILGNHDFGGYGFETGWDGQFYYTWCPGPLADGYNRWRMPGFYWRQKVQFKDFSVDLFMLDGNVNDVLPGDLNHNICQTTHTKAYFPGHCWVPNATMRDEHDCSDMLNKLWNDGVTWLKAEVKASTAEWQIAVVHYPPTWKRSDWYEIEETTDLDLLITGHTHVQQLFMPGKFGNPMKNFSIPWVITGGGGGVTSEGTPDENGNDDEYGFVDFTISRDELRIEMLSHGGTGHEKICRKSETIHPRKKGATDAAAHLRENVFI